MRIVEVFNARAFRLALAFIFTISIAIAGVFAFIYWQVCDAHVQRISAILVDEAAVSARESEGYLRRALELRVTRDIRRLDYVAVFDPTGALVFGDVPGMPEIPIDGLAHVVRKEPLPDSSGNPEPAIFVARRRPSGEVILLGRSLRETYDLQETILRAMGIALGPTILLILAIGAFFAQRSSQRFERIHDAIVRIMNGELESRLPVANEGDDIDKVARAVNLMLDEIERLLHQLRSTGDNIAHDLRTPLAVARARIERALNNESGIEELRAALGAALSQIDKVSTAVSAILRISAVENGAAKAQFKDFDLTSVCAQVFDFYEPCAEAKGVTMVIDAARPVPLRGDEDLVREAVSNLVDNAIKFTPAGGAVRIEARMADRRPFLRVSDTGPGVPAHERARIFERFFRGERSGKTPGHGLGLSIAEKIATLHGLKLTIEDNHPGARFELLAPAPPSAAREREPSRPFGPVTAGRAVSLDPPAAGS
jgi:signal transduction histidine kinase